MASQYLTRYMLIAVLKRFQSEAPDIHVRVSTMNESDVVGALMENPEIACGLAAPYESSARLDYVELFSMGWSLIVPPAHPLAVRETVRLNVIAAHSLILFEKGSTGRQHVLDAFHEHRLVPRIALETTNTETIVSMVEAGLGIAIVPLMANGAVTHGRQVVVRNVAEPMRRIHSGALLRRAETVSPATTKLLAFMKSMFRPRP